MNKFIKLLTLAIFATAIGFMESAIVVYLRELYYPLGFSFPLAVMSMPILKIEILREFATLVILVTISLLTGTNWKERLAAFLFLFATWDLTFYLFLKLLVGWPASLLTWDILFLIPSTWVGPVLAPVINSLTMILLAFAIFEGSSLRKSPITLVAWMLLICGTLIELYCYIWPFHSYLSQKAASEIGRIPLTSEQIIQLSSGFVPQSFNWVLFIPAALLQLASVFLIIIKTRNLKKAGSGPL